MRYNSLEEFETAAKDVCPSDYYNKFVSPRLQSLFEHYKGYAKFNPDADLRFGKLEEQSLFSNSDEAQLIMYSDELIA